MTISLEEHVARAMYGYETYCRHTDTWEKASKDRRELFLHRAGLAIAAVREREGAERSDINLRHSVEHIAALVNAGLLVEADSVLHAIELSAVDRLGPSTVTTPLPGTGGKTDQAPDPAEAMRAKCEAEMRGMADDCDRLRMWARKDAFLHGADAIAALNGNGEGR